MNFPYTNLGEQFKQGQEPDKSSAVYASIRTTSLKVLTTVQMAVPNWSLVWHISSSLGLKDSLHPVNLKKTNIQPHAPQNYRMVRAGRDLKRSSSSKPSAIGRVIMLTYIAYTTIYLTFL